MQARSYLAGGAMPSFISYSPSFDLNPDVVQAPAQRAPERLNIKDSRKQDAGKRLLGFLVRLALQSDVSDLWIVPTDESLLAMGKSEEQWSVVMKHRSFHALDVLDAVDDLSPAGLMTVVQDGVASVWKVSFSPDDVLLSRV
jgi:hypothetical protein